MFIDRECTTRPTVGESYPTLFLKFNKATTEDEYSFGNPADAPMTALDLTWSEIDSEFEINLYVDYMESYAYNPIPAGHVFELEGPPDGLLITADTVFDFG